MCGPRRERAQLRCTAPAQGPQGFVGQLPGEGPRAQSRTRGWIADVRFDDSRAPMAEIFRRLPVSRRRRRQRAEQRRRDSREPSVGHAAHWFAGASLLDCFDGSPWPPGAAPESPGPQTQLPRNCRASRPKISFCADRGRHAALPSGEPATSLGAAAAASRAAARRRSLPSPPRMPLYNLCRTGRVLEDTFFKKAKVCSRSSLM